MKPSSVFLVASLCAALLTPAAMADAYTYAGDVNEARPWAGSEKEVMTQAMEYVKALSLKADMQPKHDEQLEADIPRLREAWKAAILAHPEQVNDLFSASHDGPYTPLLLAVHANDLEMARLLLEKGAIPFLTDHDGRDAYDPRNIVSPYPHFYEARYTPDPKVMALIREARQGYNLLEICLRAQQAGHNLKEWYPKRPAWKKPEVEPTEVEKDAVLNFLRESEKVAAGQLCRPLNTSFALKMRDGSSQTDEVFFINFTPAGGAEVSAALTRYIVETVQATGDFPDMLLRYSPTNLTEQEGNYVLKCESVGGDMLLNPNAGSALKRVLEQHPEFKDKSACELPASRQL